MYWLKLVGYYVCVKCFFWVLFDIVFERVKLWKNWVVLDYVVEFILEGLNFGVEKLYEFNKRELFFEDMDNYDRNEELRVVLLEILLLIG